MRVKITTKIRYVPSSTSQDKLAELFKEMYDQGYEYIANIGMHTRPLEYDKMILLFTKEKGASDV